MAEPCPICHGSKRAYPGADIDCPICWGTGVALTTPWLACPFLPGDEVVRVRDWPGPTLGRLRRILEPVASALGLHVGPAMATPGLPVGGIVHVAEVDADGDFYSREIGAHGLPWLGFSVDFALTDGRPYSNPEYLKRDPALKGRPKASRVAARSQRTSQ